MKIIAENHADDRDGPNHTGLTYARVPALGVLGRDLRAHYGTPDADRMPDKLRDLALRLDRRLAAAP